VALTPALIADPAALSAADAAAHYESIKARFGSPERRTVQQIVFPTRAEAEAARARLAAGATYEAMAQERGVSDADLTLGAFTRVEMLDQRIAAAAFALAPGAVSEPVAGALGYALLRVTDVTPEQVRPFAEVEAEVRRELAVQRASRAVTDLHDKIEDMRASARPLVEIAAEMKLPVVAFGPVDRQRQSATGQPLPPIPAAEQVVDAMFRAEIGSDNEAVRTRDNGFVWYELTAIEPAKDRTLADVRNAVAALWRQDEVANRLQAKAREAVERIAKGEPLAAVAASLGATPATSPALTRTSNDPAYPPAVLAVAFGTRVGQAGSAALPGDAGRLVFQVTSATTPPFLRTAQEADQAAQELSLSLGDDVLVQYVAALQARQGVRIKQQSLRNATGGDS
jgi:peptidyl-prolyl cis-trans isomerase D